MKFNATPTKYKVKSLVEVPRGLYFRPEDPKKFAAVAREVTDGWMVMKAKGYMFNKGLQVELAEDAPQKLDGKLQKHFENVSEVLPAPEKEAKEEPKK